jgi:hypothetical protein
MGHKMGHSRSTEYSAGIVRADSPRRIARSTLAPIFFLSARVASSMERAALQYAGGKAFLEVDWASENPTGVSRKFENYTKLKGSGSYNIMFPDVTSAV